METEVITMDTTEGAGDIVTGEEGIQLSQEQIMHLSTGDFVEINGEMYKVEISQEEQQISQENSRQTAVNGERGMHGFYSKMAPFIDFTLSLQFLHFHIVKYLYFYE